MKIILPNRYLWIACAFLLYSCSSEKPENKQYRFYLDISRPQQQHILDLQDRHERDSLVPFLGHPDPSLRYRAAMAFASYRDSAVVTRLASLLTDKNTDVRAAAAYALGQTGARQAEQFLVNAFNQKEASEAALRSNASILEAVGKTGGQQSLIAMSTTTTYEPTDTLLVIGQARGIYRFGLRGVTHPSGTQRMVDILLNQEMPQEARVIAANYLFRATGIDTGPFVSSLLDIAENDRDPRIRMCLVVGLAKSKSQEARRLLARMLNRDSDYRVKCNILKSLYFFPYAEVRELAFQNVTSKNVHIARCAAEYLLDHGEVRDAARYRSISKGQLPWEVKSLLYGAANRYLTAAYAITKGNLNTELEDWYRRAMNPYEKAAVLNAFARDAANYSKIPGMAFKEESPVVRTAAVEILGSILSDKFFKRDIGSRTSSVRREVANYLIDAIQSGDPAMIASAATILSEPNNNLDDYARAHLETLESALIGLELPEQVEAYDALAECLAGLRKEKYVRESVAYNHPINWQAVRELPDTVKVEVVTSRGSFKMRLFTNEAPGTVLNFVQLSRDRFYHGKNFHRVVPNFVVQGGCPRGDGYGSLDYTIRSELPPMYYDTEGKVGMASAGNHTECTQWFVTHSPTPHLDGNYTLFGEVTEGMSVIHSIQIGDEIREVNIL